MYDARVRTALVIGLLAACGGDAEGFECGDGILHELELCDDGGFVRGDGCDNFCQTEPEARVTWAFYPVLGGAEQAGCRAGATEIEVVTSTTQTSQRVPCDGNRSASFFVPYNDLVLVRLRTATNDIIAESVPLRAVGSSLTAAFYEERASSRSWSRSARRPVDIR